MVALTGKLVERKQQRERRKKPIFHAAQPQPKSRRLLRILYEMKAGTVSGINRPPQTGFRAPVGQGVSGTGFEMTSPRKGTETFKMRHLCRVRPVCLK